jgi:hypothetical protein
MPTDTVQADAILAQTELDPNRPTTQSDVVALIRIWKRLNEVRTALRDATNNFHKGLAVFTPDDSVGAELKAALDGATEAYASAMIECRGLIESLPKGVTGPGGQATRQTIVLEFYGAVNRDLRSRLTPADAKRINKAAFGA